MNATAITFVAIVTVAGLLAIGIAVGYRLGKRHAAQVAITVLTRLGLDEDPHPDRPLAVFPSSLAKLLAELADRPTSAYRIQEDLDTEARIRTGETWQKARKGRP